MKTNINFNGNVAETTNNLFGFGKSLEFVTLETYIDMLAEWWNSKVEEMKNISMDEFTKDVIISKYYDMRETLRNLYYNGSCPKETTDKVLRTCKVKNYSKESFAWYESFAHPVFFLEEVIDELCEKFPILKEEVFSTFYTK